VVFGRSDAPNATVGQAVAASCAIPGFYHPVKIGGRRYVDGGICSASNLDLLRDEELNLVVCLNPMSSLAKVTPHSPTDRIAAAMRKQVGRRLGVEARKLRERGTAVLILQPTAEDLALMGPNLMAKDRREEVTKRRPHHRPVPAPHPRPRGCRPARAHPARHAATGAAQRRAA
jgi:NTE family protein